MLLAIETSVSRFVNATPKLSFKHEKKFEIIKKKGKSHLPQIQLQSMDSFVCRIQCDD